MSMGALVVQLVDLIILDTRNAMSSGSISPEELERNHSTTQVGNRDDVGESVGPIQGALPQ